MSKPLQGKGQAALSQHLTMLRQERMSCNSANDRGTVVHLIVDPDVRRLLGTLRDLFDQSDRMTADLGQKVIAQGRSD